MWPKVFLIFLAIHQLFYWVYTWQIKEYRFDRWWNWLINDSKWWWKQFDVLKWYRPKVTFRTVLTLLVGLVTIWLMWPWWWFLGIILGGLVTKIWEPLFNWQKKRIINKAKILMRKSKGVVIGITGSFGKSTVKEMLVEVLSNKYRVVSTPKNINSEIGVAQTVLGWSDNYEIAIVEMGAYKIGEIMAICDIVLPKYGVITGLGDQHLSLFGSIENIKKAKYELIECLPVIGKGWVIDKDFSINNAKNIKEDQNGVFFKYEGTKFEVPILGKQLISNVIAVIKVAEELGMTKQEIAVRLKNLDVNNYWPKKVVVNENLVVIDNSYNASVNSFLSLLDYVKTWKGYKKILVTPGMIELSKNEEKDHELVGVNLKEIDSVLLTNDKNFSQLNRWDNVKVVNLSKLLEEIKKNIYGKTLVIFKSRTPRSIIDQVINRK